MRPKLIAFMNAYSHGKTGGDIAFIETFKRLKVVKLTTITSRLGKQLCTDSKLRSSFIITSQEKEFKHVISTYMLRTIKALFLDISLKPKDILYGTSDTLPDALPLAFFKLRNSQIKWIQKIFHLVPADRRLSYWSQKISLFLIRKFADLIIVDNKLLKEDLIQKGFKEKTIKVNYLGIDFRFFQGIKPSDKKYDAAFMARLHPSKGIYDLIDIWSNVIKKKPDSTLAIIGNGQPDIVKKLRSQIKKKGVGENISMLGYLNDSDAFSIIKASRIFIYPSREEGFGIVIAEVLACGIPIIAFDLPVYREIFKGLICTVPLTINGDHIDKFAELSYNLLRQKDHWKRLSDTGKRGIQNLSWDVVAKREIALIQNV